MNARRHTDRPHGLSTFILLSAFVAVAAVAAVAGWISYTHAIAVVRQSGQTGGVLYAYPATIDGVIYTASMVLLACAKRNLTAPKLAKWSLAVGILMTVSVNVYSEVAHGWLGMTVGGLPAVSLIVSYEMAMFLVRHLARDSAPAARDGGVAPVPTVTVERLNGHRDKVLEVFGDDLAQGQVPGIRRLKSGLGVGTETATMIRDALRESGTGSPSMT